MSPTSKDRGDPTDSRRRSAEPVMSQFPPLASLEVDLFPSSGAHPSSCGSGQKGDFPGIFVAHEARGDGIDGQRVGPGEDPSRTDGPSSGGAVALHGINGVEDVEIGLSDTEEVDHALSQPLQRGGTMSGLACRRVGDAEEILHAARHFRLDVSLQLGHVDDVIRFQKKPRHSGPRQGKTVDGNLDEAVVDEGTQDDAFFSKHVEARLAKKGLPLVDENVSRAVGDGNAGRPGENEIGQSPKKGRMGRDGLLRRPGGEQIRLEEHLPRKGRQSPGPFQGKGKGRLDLGRFVGETSGSTDAIRRSQATPLP